MSGEDPIAFQEVVVKEEPEEMIFSICEVEDTVIPKEEPIEEIENPEVDHREKQKLPMVKLVDCLSGSSGRALRRSARSTKKETKINKKVKSEVFDSDEDQELENYETPSSTETTSKSKFFNNPDKISYALIEDASGTCTLQLTDTTDEPHSWVKCCLCGFDYDDLNELSAHITYHYIAFYSCLQCVFRRCLYSIVDHVKTCHPDLSENFFAFEVVFHTENRKIRKPMAHRRQKWKPYEFQLEFLKKIKDSETKEDDVEEIPMKNEIYISDSDEDEKPLTSLLIPIVNIESAGQELEPFRSLDKESLMFCSKNNYFLLLSFVQDEKSFFCQVCSLSFTKSEYLKLHMVQKHKCSRFKNKTCLTEEEFMFVGNYTEIHPNTNQLIDDYSDGFQISLKFKRNQKIDVSIDKKNTTKCDFCYEKSRSFEELINHIKEDHKVNGFECKSCCLVEPLEYIKSHMYTNHRGAYNINFDCISIVPETTVDIFYIFYVNRLTVLRGNRQNTTCKVCSFFFDDLEVFDSHMKNKHSVFTYSCLSCNQTVDDIMALDTHVAHNTTFFECVLSKRKLTDVFNGDLNCHYVAGKIGRILSNSNFSNCEDIGIMVKLKVSKGPTCHCLLCDKDNFTAPGWNIKQHLLMVHNVSSYDRFHCIICKQKVHYDMFVQHCAVHKRKGILGFTYKTPSTKSWLRMYSVIGNKDCISNVPQESENNRFVCGICPSFSGKTSDEFGKHVKGVHMIAQHFQCNKCWQAVDFDHLITHSISQHPAESSSFEAPKQQTIKDTKEPAIKRPRIVTDINRKPPKKSYTYVLSIEDSTETINVKSGRKDEFYCRKCEREFDNIDQFKAHLSLVHKTMPHTICDKCKNVQTTIEQIGSHMRNTHLSNIQTFRFKVISSEAKD
ncbi:hypothetical protein ACFFRR_007595 [Megaselia abdita]